MLINHIASLLILEVLAAPAGLIIFLEGCQILAGLSELTLLQAVLYEVMNKDSMAIQSIELVVKVSQREPHLHRVCQSTTRSSPQKVTRRIKIMPWDGIIVYGNFKTQRAPLLKYAVYWFFLLYSL